MPEYKDKASEWPVVDGAPLNPYDVDTSTMPRDDEDVDPDAAMPKGDVLEDRDAMSAPAEDLGAAVPGPGGGDMANASDGDDAPPKRKGK